MTQQITNMPYRGQLTKGQQDALVDLLWDYLKRVKGVDQVHTGWGTKTQTGLIASIEAIINRKD